MEVIAVSKTQQASMLGTQVSREELIEDSLAHMRQAVKRIRSAQLAMKKSNYRAGVEKCDLAVQQAQQAIITMSRV